MSTTTQSFNAAELQELIAAKDVDLSNTEQNASAFTDTWAASDATTEGQWWADWATMRDAYNAARARAETYLDELSYQPLALTHFDATYEYGLVQSSLNASWQTSTRAPGSFDDLVARLGVAENGLGYVSPITPQPLPQPNPSNDSGLGPDSWEAYVTGAAAKLGIVQNPPPGTPGTGGGPPLIPSWLKAGAIAAAALYALDKLVEFKRNL